MPGTLDLVRQRCRAVVEQATRVRVDEDRLDDLAASLPADVAVVDPAAEAVGDEATTVAFALTWNAVNFGSGWSPVLRKRRGLSFSRTLASLLRERFVGHGPFSAAELRSLDTKAVAALFAQDPAGPAADLMALFTRALQDLGAEVAGTYGGSFAALVEDAGRSAERLVAILDRQPLFHDVSPYRGLEVPFFKRAQITSSHLHGALGGAGLGRFDDLDRLTMFADNLVPHVLRVEGALRYDEDLATTIDAGEPLTHDSEAEVEIRAAGVHAVELLVDRLRGRGRDVTAAGVDHLLWNLGALPRYKAVPRHRSRGAAY